MEKLQKIDQFFSDKIVWFTILCLLLGIFFHAPLSNLVPITPVLFAMMTFINTLGCSFRQIGHVVSHPVPVLVLLAMLHVVLPALCLGLCTLLFPDAPLFTTGLVLNFVLPTGVASLMWVTIGRGDLPLCLSAVLLDTLLAPLIVPLSMLLPLDHQIHNRVRRQREAGKVTVQRIVHRTRHRRRHRNIASFSNGLCPEGSLCPAVFNQFYPDI